MPEHPLIRHTIELAFDYRIYWTRAVFSPGNPLLAQVLSETSRRLPVKAVACLDDGLVARQPDLPARIGGWFTANPQVATLVQPPAILPGGEAGKNEWRRVEHVWELIRDGHICRHSFVLAVGGGALLDLVGFAAATAHRGVKLIRLPTTSLAQADSGVGVKNAVNVFRRKNWVGTFSVPAAVINDVTFLGDLPPAELRAGLIETLKIALIRDRALFEWMCAERGALAALELPAIERALHRSAELHARHIATSGDPFETGSARPLDFGHWTAHKLEQISDFTISHGAAVSIGMAVDLRYAARIGLLDPADAEAILRLMADLRFPLWHPLLDQRNAAGDRAILDGLEEFREHLGGELTVTLVEAIGRGREVHAMQREDVLAAMDDLRTRSE